jgi:hypothetical protein
LSFKAGNRIAGDGEFLMNGFGVETINDGEMDRPQELLLIAVYRLNFQNSERENSPIALNYFQS